MVMGWGGLGEQSSRNKWSDFEDLLVSSCKVLEPGTSRSVEHVRGVNPDAAPSSGKIALFILVRARRNGGSWQLLRGTTGKTGSREQGRQAEHPESLGQHGSGEGRPGRAVTWPAPTKRRAGDASESRSLADHCWSTPGWCFYDKHSRQLATKVLLQH